jgi:TetR/AcrR family transcriptional repressor of nem operon
MLLPLEQKPMKKTTYNPEVTRQRLLEAAAEEFCSNGFRATSLDRILSKTGVTKGALYHHFQNKLELGYAVVDEVYRKRMIEMWVKALRRVEDPVEALSEHLKGMGEGACPESIINGCPMNNLAQEMASVDEGFRKRIEAAFDEWRSTISQALKRGQAGGTVRENLDTRKAAIFIVSVIEGGAGAAKNARDPEILESCLEGLIHYLGALRPRAGLRPAVAI